MKYRKFYILNIVFILNIIFDKTLSDNYIYERCLIKYLTIANLSTQRSTHLYEDVTGLRCDLKQTVLQVMTGMLGTPAAATHFPSKKRHFDHVRRTFAIIILLTPQGRGEPLVVDRTRVHAETGFVDGFVVSAARLLHHVRHPHRYLSADKAREMSSVSTSVHMRWRDIDSDCAFKI